MLLKFDSTTGDFDFALTAAGGLDSGVGNGGLLQSAIWASLFTDGVADPADLQPELGDDRRGWWGDSGRAPSDSLACSLLWLHMREKRSEAVRLAIQYAAEDCLQWLVEDGVASAIEVSVAWLASPLEGARLTVTTCEPNGVRRDWTIDLVWSGIAG